MDITLEQVEKVRSCTGASYEEAKAALERKISEMMAKK